MELDRAFVVNGDDLRIVLAGDGSDRPLVPDPRTTAGYILAAVARPASGRDCPDPGAHVVDAHICCEHAAPGDPEVAAMAALAPALAALRRLRHDEAMRVMRWATDRATGNLPPF